MKTPVDIDSEISRPGRNGGWVVLACMAFGLLLGSGATLRWAWGADRFVFWLVLVATVIMEAILVGIAAPWRRGL